MLGDPLHDFQGILRGVPSFVGVSTPQLKGDTENIDNF
jgi:hypothetical protein